MYVEQEMVLVPGMDPVSRLVQEMHRLPPKLYRKVVPGGKGRGDQG